MNVSEALRCVEDGESGIIGVTLAAEVKRLQTSLAGRTYCHSDAEVEADLEFAYKRAKVLADMLKIPVHESPEFTGTILGLVRGSVERLQKRVAELEAAIVTTLNENGHLADGDICTLIGLKRAMPTWELE
jgi:hypothetical protein